MAKIKLVKELRDISERDLVQKVKTFQTEYLQLRFTNKLGQLTDKSLLRKSRRDIARSKTILEERQKKDVQTK